MAFTELKIDAYTWEVSGMRPDGLVVIKAVGHDGAVELRLPANQAARLSYRLAEQVKKEAKDILHWATPEEVLGKERGK